MNREGPLDLFEAAVKKPQARDEYCVLSWYGVGGQGKSALSREMQRRIEEQGDIALGSIDFDVSRHRRMETALLKLRGDLVASVTNTTPSSTR